MPHISHKTSHEEGTAAPVEPTAGVRHKKRFIILMFLVCLVDFADRSVFAVLAQTIKEELRLSDFQVGILQGLAFALLYSMMGLPLARLSEHFSRRKIVAFCCFFWSCATAWCGFAQSFIHLAIGRIGVGVGEAGFLPAANSMVGDQFPKNRRASIMSIIMLGTPIGILSGALIGGHIAALTHWRNAFYFLGGAGVLIAAMVWLLVREPERGFADGYQLATAKPVPSFKDFLSVLKKSKALLFIIMGGATAGFGMTSISQFLAVFLARVHNLDVATAAQYYGGISATFLVLGLLLGSFGTDRLAKRDNRWPAWGAAIGLAVSPFLYWAAFEATTLMSMSILLVLAGTSMLIFYGPSAGMIQNLLEPRMRATGIACFTLCYTLIGSGLGPTFIGYVSDYNAASVFIGDFATSCPGGLAPAGSEQSLIQSCELASATGIKNALKSVLFVLFLASGLYFMASRHIKK